MSASGTRCLLFLVAALLLTSGCASFNDAMTPSVQVKKDSFDGSTIVRQPLVNAAGSFTEPRHLLGFDWSSRTPDSVFITAGIVGTRAVSGVQFNVDGTFIKDVKVASATTEFTNIDSSRRFELSFQQFVAIANGKSVKMRLDSINDYTVSSFGPDGDGSMAMVNPKFQPFLAKVKEVRGRP